MSDENSESLRKRTKTAAEADTESRVHQWLRRVVAALAAESSGETVVGADLSLGGGIGSSGAYGVAAAEAEEKCSRRETKWAVCAASPPPGLFEGQRGSGGIRCASSVAGVAACISSTT